MACGFCIATPVNPCPVCGPADHSGNTKLRKAHKPAPRVPRKPIPGAVYVIDGGPLRPVGQAPVPGTNSRAKYTPPPPVRQTTVDAWAKQAMPVIRASVAAWDAQKVNPAHVPAAPPIAPQRPVQPARMGILTPITPEDWRAAERFVRGVLWAPRLVDTTAQVVTQRDEEPTLPPISRGDFRGLWVAVEAGHLSEAAAIELAASWAGARQ